MQTSTEHPPAPLPRVIATAAEAEQAVTYFSGVMRDLLGERRP